MAARDLSVLVAIAAASMFGQVGAPVKAGDPAPNLTWTKIVASTPTSAGPQTPLGQTTVLLFPPPFGFKIQGEAGKTEEFLGMLRDPLGLVLTAPRRSIEITVIRPVE
jgi:hypothetical protein